MDAAQQSPQSPLPTAEFLEQQSGKIRSVLKSLKKTGAAEQFTIALELVAEASDSTKQIPKMLTTSTDSLLLDKAHAVSQLAATLLRAGHLSEASILYDVAIAYSERPKLLIAGSDPKFQILLILSPLLQGAVLHQDDTFFDRTMKAISNSNKIVQPRKDESELGGWGWQFSCAIRDCASAGMHERIPPVMEKTLSESTRSGIALQLVRLAREKGDHGLLNVARQYLPDFNEVKNSPPSDSMLRWKVETAKALCQFGAVAEAKALLASVEQSNSSRIEEPGRDRLVALGGMPQLGEQITDLIYESGAVPDPETVHAAMGTLAGANFLEMRGKNARAAEADLMRKVVEFKKELANNCHVQERGILWKYVEGYISALLETAPQSYPVVLDMFEKTDNPEAECYIGLMGLRASKICKDGAEESLIQSIDRTLSQMSNLEQITFIRRASDEINLRGMPLTLAEAKFLQSNLNRLAKEVSGDEKGAASSTRAHLIKQIAGAGHWTIAEKLLNVLPEVSAGLFTRPEFERASDLGHLCVSACNSGDRATAEQFLRRAHREIASGLELARGEDTLLDASDVPKPKERFNAELVPEGIRISIPQRTVTDTDWLQYRELRDLARVLSEAKVGELEIDVLRHVSEAAHHLSAGGFSAAARWTAEGVANRWGIHQTSLPLE